LGKETLCPSDRKTPVGSQTTRNGINVQLLGPAIPDFSSQADESRAVEMPI
jgi:hypothetical protein